MCGSLVLASADKTTLSTLFAGAGSGTPLLGAKDFLAAGALISVGELVAIVGILFSCVWSGLRLSVQSQQGEKKETNCECLG